MMRCLVVAVSVAVAGALSTQSVSRARFLRSAEAAALTWASSRVAWADDYETLDSGLRYKVLKKGDGAVPKVGDLICIRFKGSFEGRVFDDITETPEPLYYRVGSGTLIKGIDEALPLMRFGDTWSLVIPGPLGFGPKVSLVARVAGALHAVIMPGASWSEAARVLDARLACETTVLAHGSTRVAIREALSGKPQTTHVFASDDDHDASALFLEVCDDALELWTAVHSPDASTNDMLGSILGTKFCVFVARGHPVDVADCLALVIGREDAVAGAVVDTSHPRKALGWDGPSRASDPADAPPVADQDAPPADSAADQDAPVAPDLDEPPAVDLANEVPYERRTVAQLKEALKERSLKVSGRKADLVERLQQHDEAMMIVVGHHQLEMVLQVWSKTDVGAHDVQMLDDDIDDEDEHFFSARE
ncbi:hypothetical protein CTAYLR_001888 [Chrysophaeum taylorii]|uniref:peptidylprolyl isomerase n=1 Tax=Chrysophaeum taylorii TaxID=2483200 RepID=A0AAD7XJ37_9STRA|nr:hypothetical protein CTAYLR_001888 [Chrysophaeum taylorii]